MICARLRPRYAKDSAVHPYRQLPTDHEARSAPSEERVLYAVLCAVGAIPVAIALLLGGGFGAEATVGLLMALAGLAGLWTQRAVHRVRERRRPDRPIGRRDGE